ncbi:class I glutamine amidotransferase-like protein [Microdochium trichocladiopsis]|uniref:Class I glutamine amidotransferase-like protein n=1 Tax=Microdochium trichocladiopsis TaxID=1682393 RepID=A0A9P8Y766_9PEZI|nr:class I glutamine amidotransferase-like protein [Microdochium trichocladiopsis]KAH7031524.1 class I glutamine amidotransferase-like protein [Microdochium trichocladiopsis]
MGSAPPAPHKVRLAILEADTPVPGIQAKYKTYGGVFRHLFSRALSLDSLDSPDSPLAITHHDVVNGDFASAYPDPEDIDAVLITGSKHNSFDADPWIEHLVQYTRRVLEGGRVRVVGVCFGHQIVARALGAEVGRNTRGWELSVVPLELNDEGKKVFGRSTLSIHQMHRDAVLTLPPGCTPLASTDVCAIQAMYIPDRMISVQGHPEFTADMVREILELRKYGGILGDDIFADGMRRVGDHHDGVEIARTFLRFIGAGEEKVEA